MTPGSLTNISILFPYKCICQVRLTSVTWSVIFIQISKLTTIDLEISASNLCESFLRLTSCLQRFASRGEKKWKFLSESFDWLFVCLSIFSRWLEALSHLPSGESWQTFFLEIHNFYQAKNGKIGRLFHWISFWMEVVFICPGERIFFRISFSIPIVGPLDQIVDCSN